MSRNRLKLYVLSGSSNINTVNKIKSEFIETKRILVNNFNKFNPKIITL